MQQGTRSRELLLIMLPTDIYLGVQCFHNLIQEIRFTAQSKGIADVDGSIICSFVWESLNLSEYMWHVCIRMWYIRTYMLTNRDDMIRD